MPVRSISVDPQRLRQEFRDEYLRRVERRASSGSTELTTDLVNMINSMSEQLAFVQGAQKKGFKLFQHPQTLKRSAMPQLCSPFLQPQALPAMATPTHCPTPQIQTLSGCGPSAAASHPNACGQLDHQTEIARRSLQLAQLERERLRAEYEAAEYKRMIGVGESPQTPLKSLLPKRLEFSQEKSSPAHTILAAGAGGFRPIAVQAKASTTAVSPGVPGALVADTPKARPSPTEATGEDIAAPAPVDGQEEVGPLATGEEEAFAGSASGEREAEEKSPEDAGALADEEAMAAAAAKAEKEAAQAVGEAEEDDEAEEAPEAEEPAGEDD
jgi:hypothetical protein